MCSVRCGPGDPVGASRLLYQPRVNPGEGLVPLFTISTSSTRNIAVSSQQRMTRQSYYYYIII